MEGPGAVLAKAGATGGRIVGRFIGYLWWHDHGVIKLNISVHRMIANWDTICGIQNQHMLDCSCLVDCWSNSQIPALSVYIGTFKK